MTLPVIRTALLNYPRLSHAFFTRRGGVSDGLYASLNGGVGSKDRPDAVADNRRLMAEALGVAPSHLLVPYQIHSNRVLTVEAPWATDERPQGDGLVTRIPGLALGVTGADCGMVLFADAQAGVIGACHSGWKGAFDDVAGATVAAMVDLGARRDRVVAVLGPTIAQASYEVGPDFVARFLERDASFDRFFKPSGTSGHSLFDLPGLIGHRCRAAGVGLFEDMRLDTYPDENQFYSYRRTTHRREADYGRLVSAIVIR
ncbi:polyphenol oxidase family protein [Lichenihabitans sp. Uapishka_5]|uniref:polyphenol oxidase family protein n=1 Tax=Lichenihabitans sp. Uapishka_5 TaxID=3037302 RepID=UPI0029E82496|nr:polyphenol oxidase family protein [Lichenihabitans sp. Uapishka_5]MDX7951154.1 polyphenol oxidase family protein [Lichenihabitans sp. Uapishka_5]